MKRTFFFLSTIWLLFSCSETTESPLVGKWQMLEVVTPDSTGERRIENPGNVIIEFTHDGKAITHMPDTSIVGNYSFNQKDSSLVLLNPLNGERFDCRVLIMNDMMEIVHPENSARLKKL